MAFVIYKGIEWRRRLTVTDTETGARTHLTGRVIAFQLRRRSGEAVLVELTVGSGITLLDQEVDDTKGLADVVIADTVTAGLEAASHIVVVLLDDQVALAPLKLAVRAL